MKTDPRSHARVFPRLSSRFHRSRHSIIALVLPSLALLFMSGCDVHMSVGIRPDVRALEGVLTVGHSTQADVLAVLGPPSGKGQEMFPIGRDIGAAYNYHQKPRTMWSYYYEEASLKDDRRILLFVFFDADRYDGYMWFSSLPDAGSQVSKTESDRTPSLEARR